MGFERFRDRQFVSWARSVKKRDGFACRVCGKKGGILHAHHLFGWDRYVELRYIISNGITLCSMHHHILHDIYGKGNNHAYQMIEMLKSIDAMIEILKLQYSEVVNPSSDGYSENREPQI